MRRLAFAALGLGLATAAPALAQDPVTVNPKNYHVLVDNPRVRVLHVTAAAGEKTVLHEHPDNMVVVLTDGRMTFTGADGKSETVDMKAGSAMWSPAGKHMGTNAGTTPLEAVVVELKGSAAPTATLPASRPNLSRTTLVENARAAAFAFTADAAFKEEPKTTHDYDQVLIATGPAAMSVEIGGKTTTAWKRGDVVFIGRGQPHQAQNTSGKPQYLAVVVIK
jgi:quercetin dioxygenase-like cupin family protein